MRGSGERIRDKIAASRRKGMWMGGPVPLGYDAIDRKLVINPAEAPTVRRIFDRYLALGTIRHLKAELDAEGINSKARTNRTGDRIGGRGFSRGALALILRNPLYIGEVQHKGARFPGQHEPIIAPDVWAAAQATLDQQRLARRRATNAAAPNPLAGMLFHENGEPLVPGHASKGPARIRYRYYISHRLSDGFAADQTDAWRLPAEPVERAVRQALIGLLRDADQIRDLLAGSGSATRHRHLLGRIDALIGETNNGNGPALRELLTMLSARIEIGPESLTLSISRSALLQQLDPEADRDAPDRQLISRRPLMLRKRGVETKLVLGDVIAAEPDQGLIRLVADARSWARQLLDGDVGSVRALARQLGLDHRHVARALPLAFLAPDIVAAILEGRQPVELTATRLKRIDTLPIRWQDQRHALGFHGAA